MIIHTEEPMPHTLSSSQTSKNFLALSIVLGGLFIGSLFVDIGQLVVGRGFSRHAVRDHEVLEQNGKTWVSYGDPKISLTILNDSQCSSCNTDEALVWLRRVLPTLSVNTIESGSEEGKMLAAEHNILSVPAFIFGDNIKNTDFYTQAATLFKPSDSGYILDMTELGLPAGKYLHTPEISDESVVLGNREAPVKVVVYSDFQCTYCAGFHTNQLKKLLSEYGSRVAFVFKAFPLETDPKSPTIASAALCANDQGKYFDYSSALFAKQRELGQRPNTKQELKNIAWMAKLNWKPFSDCIDQNQHQDQIKKEGGEARALGLNAAPAVFIGEKFFSGAVEYDTLREALDETLNTKS